MSGGENPFRCDFLIYAEESSKNAQEQIDNKFRMAYSDYIVATFDNNVQFQRGNRSEKNEKD